MGSFIPRVSWLEVKEVNAVQSLYLHNTPRPIQVSIKLITVEGKKCEEDEKRWGNHKFWNAREMDYSPTAKGRNSELITGIKTGMHQHKPLKQLGWLVWGEENTLTFPVLQWLHKLSSNKATFENETGAF